MKRGLTDQLCTRCGLCCDGSLFADVELAGSAEAAGLEVMGLEIEEDDADGALLVQPCAALRGKRCGIYAHRPDCCRTFECRLLQDARRGAVSVGDAVALIAETLKRIRHVRKLVAELGQTARLPLKECYADAMTLTHDAQLPPALNRKRAELEAAMSDLNQSLEGNFLRDTG
jgi:uncharacterized protein